ncbi:MAG TPA: VacJ family lipoprotein [Gallionellaceae bacterium]|nr:VacJ family lipoprotein [Gallionellaceae bacterium]
MSATRFCFLLALLALTGCSSTNPKDPFEGYNRAAYKFNDTVDRAVLKPVAKGYNEVTPKPAKNMIHNFFSNLDDVVVTFNDLLQLKFAQAAADGTRVIINSTFGVLGLINVADRLEKHNEDFGQTLGYWGVSSGPYLVIPILGPSSVRDGAGLYVDTSYVSVIGTMDDVATRNQLYIVKGVEQRAGLLDMEKVLDDSMLDRYAFIRDAYMMRRQNLVYDGNPPKQKFEDDDE